MATTTITAHINAPRQRTFDIFTDLRSASSRIRAIEALEVLTDGPIGKGTRFAETRIMCRRPHTETMEITGWNPPESYTVECESCGARYTTEFRFHDDADGGTTVDIIFAVAPVTVMAKLMSVMSGLMMSACRKLFEKDLADLKAAAEAPAIASAQT